MQHTGGYALCPARTRWRPLESIASTRPRDQLSRQCRAPCHPAARHEKREGSIRAWTAPTVPAGKQRRIKANRQHDRTYNVTSLQLHRGRGQDALHSGHVPRQDCNMQRCAQHGRAGTRLGPARGTTTRNSRAKGCCTRERARGNEAGNAPRDEAKNAAAGRDKRDAQSPVPRHTTPA